MQNVNDQIFFYLTITTGHSLGTLYRSLCYDNEKAAEPLELLDRDVYKKINTVLTVKS